MKKLSFAVLFFIFAFSVQAQFVINRSGNWTDANPGTTPWQGGVPASTVSDDATMMDGFNVTVIGTDNITTGNLATGNTNTLTVQPFGTLQLGDAGNTRNLTAGTSMTITVQNNGTIIIWGDLMVNSSLIIAIQGPLGKIIIKGNVNLADNATLTVNGDLEVDGNFTGGMNTDVVVGAGGAIGVNGTLTVGAGSFFHASCTSGVPPGGVNCGTFHAHACAGDADSQAFCGTAGLPVEVIFFRAQATQRSVHIEWATASELNFDYFVIEKSTDGRTFSEIATLQGSGTSRTRIDYSADDVHPTSGTAYYRLTEVDLDNSIHYLKIASVDFSGEKSVGIFPNPVTDGKLNFELNFIPEGTLIASIVDIRGNVITEFTLNKQNLSLPVQLAPGIYIVSVRSGDFKSISKLVVK